MEQYYNQFCELLESEDRYGCIKYAQQLLSEKRVGIVELYQDIIKPSLQNITCKVNEKNMCVWEEHVRSAIARTVIECCYTYVVEEAIAMKSKHQGKVVVICPQGEYHDIGARMIADFFTISGFETVFVGSNTPKADFLAAVESMKPNYVAISVTDYYNLFSAKKSIESIKSKVRADIKIIAGGNAFKSNPDAFKIIGADYLVDTFADIKNIGGI
jgi:MerR family transcriptional regulator, light-induced transcriptional regulator